MNEILAELRAGRMIVLVDDEQRENEGDLVCAAEHITPEVVNFMVTVGRGLLCVALDGSICDRLELSPQAAVNTAQMATAYTVTVDAGPRFGITTGVSAADRSTTIKQLAAPDARPTDFARPGHVNPLRSRTGGVLVRTGQTEGSVDLCKLAGLRPAAAIIEIMNEDGTMARLPELRQICQKQNLKMCTVADVIAHRLQQEKLIERVDEAPLDTAFGRFNLIAYRSAVDALPHVALTRGRVGQQAEIDEPVLVRMHTQNLLGDVFAATFDASGQRLHEAMRRVAAADEGAVVYLRQDGMGTGLLQRLQTLAAGADRKPEEVARVMQKFDFGIGSQILRDLGIRRLKLLTNHPPHLHGLDGFGLSIDDVIAM